MREIIAKLEAATGPDRAIIDRLDRAGSCWLWTGALDERGRGRVWHHGKLKLHHRAVWEILNGPIPGGALLCHHCDNPQCANPDHLYIGDGKSNVADMFGRGRHWTQVDPERAAIVGMCMGRRNNWTAGNANPRAKLSPAQVEDIKVSSLPNRQLATQFNIDITTIQRIKRGKLWAKT